jgi:hypothetical protein
MGWAGHYFDLLTFPHDVQYFTQNSVANYGLIVTLWKSFNDEVRIGEIFMKRANRDKHAAEPGF